MSQKLKGKLWLCCSVFVLLLFFVLPVLFFGNLVHANWECFQTNCNRIKDVTIEIIDGVTDKGLTWAAEQGCGGQRK
jgi:hypothetical protein